MAQRRGAGASAEELVAAVRIHLDRVHDAVLRLGCPPAGAAGVVEASAVDLLDAVARRPDTVADPVGWWFARARALSARTQSARTQSGSPASREGADQPPRSGTAPVDQSPSALAEALGALPETERLALVMRDCYDLPIASVGAALGVDGEAAMTVVGRARLAFMALGADPPVPGLPSHQSDPGAVARIAGAGPVAARDATVQRHVRTCPACRDVADTQRRAHALLTGLLVVVLPDDLRVGMLARIEDAAYRVLPTSAALVLATQEQQRVEEQTLFSYREDDDDEPRLFSPLLVLLAFVVAGLVGLGVGLLLSRDSKPSPIEATGRSALASPSPSRPEMLISPPVVEPPAPVTSVFVVPSPSPSPPPSPSPSPTPSVAMFTLSLDPASGGNGAELFVSGTGWPPNAAITLEYLGVSGQPTGSRKVVLADAGGRFGDELIAEDPTDQPGRHSVRASAGTRTLTAPYEVES